MSNVENQKKMSVNEGVDSISDLPDALLGAIISLLPDTEGVRTCVLSPRWKEVWKNHGSHLHLDQRKILESIRYDGVGNIYNRAENLINSMLDSHNGTLISCTILHLCEQYVRRKVVGLIKKLLEEKNVKRLSMEIFMPAFLRSVTTLPVDFIYKGRDLDFPFEIFSGFEELELKNYRLQTSPTNDVPSQVLRSLIFNNVKFSDDVLKGILLYCLCLENLTFDDCKAMKVVKIDSSRLKFLRICKMMVTEIMVSATILENFEIDSVVCTENIKFQTPKVRVFSLCYGMQIGWLRESWAAKNLLQSTKLLSTCGSSLSSQGSTSSCASIFENLETLYIDIDLKSVTNAAALFSALKSCPQLQNLEINSQVIGEARYYNNNQENEDNSPITKLFFWKNKEFCHCIHHQIKTLSIKGFEGEELQLEFLKYMITTAEVMKKITIWFIDDCKWVSAIATRCLLSFPKASLKLSIVLKPGPLPMTNIDDNFNTWLSTLRD